jgi:hypothetical protein
MERYPDAKVILTVRDPDARYASRLPARPSLEEAKPSQVTWCYFYLTLERQKPAGPTEFHPVTYERLCETLPAAPNLARGSCLLIAALRNRFVDNYQARTEVLEGEYPSDDKPLEGYLSDTWGLVEETLGDP